MRTRSRKSGFSLVELLTVIAIIAILAAIIFPVMNAVKQRAQENDCMTRLHQVQLALGLYKTDNRKYPPVLLEAKPDPNTGSFEMMENAKGDYLYAEYMKSFRSLHCPSSKVTNTSELARYPLVPYDPRSQEVIVYAYDSFDCRVGGIPTGGYYPTDKVEQHYAIDWAPDAENIDASGTKPDPAAGPDTAKAAQYDFQRQLKFKTPPGDTVVTWCSYHSPEDNSGRALVVFLDGHVASYQARDMDAYRWRIRQKKE